MGNDKSGGSQSRSRRFARSLFSSSSKTTATPPQFLAPRSNSLVPEVQTESRPRTPVEKPKNSRIPSPIPEDPPEEEPEPQPVEETKPPAGSLSKRLSRQSLYDLFSKPKVEKARGHHGENRNSLVQIPERSQTPLPMSAAPSRRKQVRSAHIDLSPIKETKQMTRAPEPIARSSSRLSLRPSKSNLAESFAEPQEVKPNESWAPPPLFQAYPQAIKHAKLQSVTSSTEIFLRSQQIKRNLAMEASGSNPHITSPFIDDATAPATKESTKLKRHSMMDYPELVEKIFVLVTAGRLLQYSVSGHSDRSAEKVLALGPHSAAFACDLVPGKHFVVQVVQSSEDINQSALRPQRSLINRLKATGSVSGRKNANSVLLIFNSAAEMDTWIKAIRKIIEQVGGKPRGADPEIARTKEQEARQQQRLRELPSHRFLVHRDSQRFTDDRRDSISPVMPPAQLPKLSPNEIKRSSFLASTDSFAISSNTPEASPLLEQESFAASSSVRRLSSHENVARMPPSSMDRNLSPELLKLEPLKETSRFTSTSTRTGRVSMMDAPSMTSRSSYSNEKYPEKSFARFGPLRPMSSNPNSTIASRRRTAQPLSAATPSLFPNLDDQRHAINPAGLHTEAEKVLRLDGAIPTMPDQVGLAHPNPRGPPVSDQINDLAAFRAGRRMSDNIHNNRFSTPRYAPDASHLLPARPQSSIGNVSVQSMRGKDGRVFSDPIHTAPRARPFFRPLPVRPAKTNDLPARKPMASRFESLRTNPAPRSSSAELIPSLPDALSVDEHLRKVLEERMIEERMMKERMTEKKQASPETNSVPWTVQITEEVVTEVVTSEPEPEHLALARSVPSIDSDVRDEKVLSNIMEADSQEEEILNLNALDDDLTETDIVRPSTPRLKRASIHDLLEMKEPSPERPVLSIQQRSRADRMHYSQAGSRPAILNKRILSAPLPNPPSMPLPAPPPLHMPSLSTRPSSRNAFAPPPVTGIRPGRRTPSVTSVNGGRNFSSRSSSPTNGHSRQSSVISRVVPPSPPKPERDIKLRRPNSMQISIDHAPFLSARRAGSLSQKSESDLSQYGRAGHMSTGPYSSLAAKKLQSFHDSELSSMVEIRENLEESPGSSHVPSSSTFHSSSQQSLLGREVSPATSFSASNDTLSKRLSMDPFVTESLSVRAVSPLVRQTSNSSSRAPSSQVSPSLDTSARSTSPTNSDHSDSVILEIGSPIRRMSSPRLSYIGASGATLRNLPPPPPLPPMNPGRHALNSKKHLLPTVSSTSSIASMSTAALADLPPPVPPPSCPLPDVPRVARV